MTNGERELTAEESKELSSAIRNAALDSMENGLRALGIAQPDIDKARAECIANDSDKPFIELVKKQRKV